MTSLLSPGAEGFPAPRFLCGPFLSLRGLYPLITSSPAPSPGSQRWLCADGWVPPRTFRLHIPGPGLVWGTRLTEPLPLLSTTSTRQDPPPPPKLTACVPGMAQGCECMRVHECVRACTCVRWGSVNHTEHKLHRVNHFLVYSSTASFFLRWDMRFLQKKYSHYFECVSN